LSLTQRRWNSVGATSTGTSPSKSGSKRESQVSQLLLETLDRSVSLNSVQLSVVFCACVKGHSSPRPSCPQIDPHLWKRLCTSSRSNFHLLRGAALSSSKDRESRHAPGSESGEYQGTGIEGQDRENHRCGRLGDPLSTTKTQVAACFSRSWMTMAPVEIDRNRDEFFSRPVRILREPIPTWTRFDGFGL